MEKYQKDKSNEKNQWMMFLANPNSREVEEIMEKNEDVKKAVVTVRKMSEDEKMEKLAELREDAIMLEKDFFEGGREEGLAEGIAEGEKRGRVTEKQEIVKKMLSKNMDIEEIIEITGFSKEGIEKIKKDK